MAWLIGLVGLLAALVTIFVLMDQLGQRFDKDDDPKIINFKKAVAVWLTAEKHKSFSSRVQLANELFFHWFDALFQGKGTLLEQGLWLGLIFSPVMLLLIRLLFLFGGEPMPQTSVLLLSAMVLAFALSLAVIAGPTLVGMFEGKGVLGGVLGGVLFGVLFSVLFGVLFSVFGGVLFSVLFGVLGGVLFGVLGGVLFGVLFGVLGGVLVSDFSYGLTGVGAALGSIALLLFRRVHLSVHPLRSVALSLVTVCVLGAFMRGATTSFYHLLLQDGPIVLSYVAFNMFADGISLLETRWVLRRSLNRGLLAILLLVLLDLVLSAAIFLILPLVLGELPSFGESMLFGGSRPWLGILFWSTFSTSVLFYLFVGAVVFFILPGHWLARSFHRTVGQRFTIESRPFSAIAWGMNLLIMALVVVGFTAIFLYHLFAR